jgi:hypothetical protein
MQALCDPKLMYLFLGMAAPGKINDVRAFHQCYVLVEYWLEKLPFEFFIGRDKTCTLSQRILIPISGAEKYV